MSDATKRDLVVARVFSAPSNASGERGPIPGK